MSHGSWMASSTCCFLHRLTLWTWWLFLGLKSDLKLPLAIQMVGNNGFETSRKDVNTYAYAAHASKHIECEAYLHFVMESLHVVEFVVTELLTTETLLLLPSHPLKLLETNDVLTKDVMSMPSSYKEKFFSQQNFICKKMEATLLNFEQIKVSFFFSSFLIRQKFTFVT